MKDATFVGPRPLVAAGNDYLSEKSLVIFRERNS